MPLTLGLDNKWKFKGPRETVGESLKEMRKVLCSGRKFGNTDTCGHLENRNDT